LSRLGTMMGYVGDRVNRGVMSPSDATFAIIGSFAKELVPNSAPAYAFSKDPVAYIAQTITPVWLSPVMQTLMNRSYTGAPISYAKAMGGNGATRMSDTASMSTAQVWRDGAQMIYNVTDGMVDVTPEEVRTWVNGYLTGPLQFIPIMMEGNDFTKVDGFENARDQLGPFWTAVGASVWYGPEVNTTNRAFYDMSDHYNARIKRAGVAKLLTGSGLRGAELQQYKTEVLMAAGFNQQEITDYLNKEKVITYVNSKLSPQYKKLLDEWKRAGADIEIMQDIWQAFSADRVKAFGEAIQGSYYYSDDYRRRWGMPDKESATSLRETIY